MRPGFKITPVIGSKKKGHNEQFQLTLIQSAAKEPMAFVKFISEKL